MVEGINGLMGKYGVTIDFDKDVLPLSSYAKGGTVTERHLASALSQRMLEVVGGGEKLVAFIKDEMKLPLSSKVEAHLLEKDNPFALYDLLGWVKSDLISKFYVDADDELPDVREALDIANEIGAISAYAYLGDVGSSVTGDKRAQKFEDDYLDELIPYIKELGFKAVTYMPSRNTRAQLDRLRALCEKYELFPDQRRGHQLPAPVLHLRGAARPVLPQSGGIHLGADRPRVALHRGRAERPVQHGEREKVARPQRARARVRP